MVLSAITGLEKEVFSGKTEDAVVIAGMLIIFL